MHVNRVPRMNLYHCSIDLKDGTKALAFAYMRQRNLHVLYDDMVKRPPEGDEDRMAHYLGTADEATPAASRPTISDVIFTREAVGEICLCCSNNR